MILFTFLLGYSLLKGGIDDIKKKYTPFGLYDPRLNVIIGIFGIICGLILLIELIRLILF